MPALETEGKEGQMGLLAGLAAGGVILGAGYRVRRTIKSRRLEYIDSYEFHEAIRRRVQKNGRRSTLRNWTW